MLHLMRRLLEWLQNIRIRCFTQKEPHLSNMQHLLGLSTLINSLSLPARKSSS